MWLLVLAALLHRSSAHAVELKNLDGLAKARVESCGGWQLNRLTQVKAFVMLDIPLYHNLVMKHIAGADPELVLLNHYSEELDRIPLAGMSRSEINELLGELGFHKKAKEEDEVPEEFRFSPAKDSPYKDEQPHKSSAASPATGAEHADL